MVRKKRLETMTTKDYAERELRTSLAKEIIMGSLGFLRLPGGLGQQAEQAESGRDAGMRILFGWMKGYAEEVSRNRARDSVGNAERDRFYDIIVIFGDKNPGRTGERVDSVKEGFRGAKILLLGTDSEQDQMYGSLRDHMLAAQGRIEKTPESLDTRQNISRLRDVLGMFVQNIKFARAMDEGAGRLEMLVVSHRGHAERIREIRGYLRDGIKDVNISYHDVKDSWWGLLEHRFHRHVTDPIWAERDDNAVSNAALRMKEGIYGIRRTIGL